MNENTLAVLEAMEGSRSIARDLVLAWMKDADLETRGAVYVLTDKAWPRIQPPLAMDEQCSFMAAYLLECLETAPKSGDYLHSGFEAAWELAAWMKHLDGIAAARHILVQVVRSIETLYRRADAETRNRIETGALEHVFERKSLRVYFAHWQSDPVLRSAFELCAEWGDAVG